MRSLFAVYHGSLNIRLHESIPAYAPLVCSVIKIDIVDGHVRDAKRGLLNRTGLTLESYSTPDWRLIHVLQDVKANRDNDCERSVLVDGLQVPIESDES